MRKLELHLHELWSAALDKMLEKEPNDILADEDAYMNKMREYTMQEIGIKSYNDNDKSILIKMLDILIKKLKHRNTQESDDE